MARNSFWCFETHKRSCVCFAALLFASCANGQTTLEAAFAACEASVVQRSDAPLREIGTFLHSNGQGVNLLLDTPQGNLLAVYVEQGHQASHCVLFGQKPESAEDLSESWDQGVDWEGAAAASELWFALAMEVQGSVDLTDRAKPGFVVARCQSLEHGLVLTSQPVNTYPARQILPLLEETTNTEPVTDYQFSAISALPGRCKAAVEAHISRK